MRALLLGMLFLGTLLVGSPVIEAAVIASNVPQMPTGASEDFYTYTQFAVGFDVGDTNQTLTSITLPMELGPASAADYTGSLLSNLSVGTINAPGGTVSLSTGITIQGQLDVQLCLPARQNPTSCILEA